MSNPNIKLHASKGGKARWMPKATHQGILKITDKQLPCVVLEDGRRIIAEVSVFRAFNKKSRGSRSEYPAVLQAQNLLPLITQEMKLSLTPVEYINNKGVISSGFSAEIIPSVCEIYLNARQMGILNPQQVSTAEISEILVSSLSRVGIIALIDEATGYQQVRPIDALEAYLNKVLGKELSAWCKRFPDAYYENIYILKGWPAFSTSKNKYSCVGHYTNDLIYSRIGEDVKEELKNRTPDTSKEKMHQWLSVDTGHPLLSKHLSEVITLQKVAIAQGFGWKRFVDLVDQILPKKQHALVLESVP